MGDVAVKTLFDAWTPPAGTEKNVENWLKTIAVKIPQMKDGKEVMGNDGKPVMVFNPAFDQLATAIDSAFL